MGARDVWVICSSHLLCSWSFLKLSPRVGAGGEQMGTRQARAVRSETLVIWRVWGDFSPSRFGDGPRKLNAEPVGSPW